MKCYDCEKPPKIKTAKTGDLRCVECFIKWFEKVKGLNCRIWSKYKKLIYYLVLFGYPTYYPTIVIKNLLYKVSSD